MTEMTRRESIAAFLIAAGSSTSLFAADETVGVTSTEIKLGQTLPYSGPASAYGAIGKAHAGYFAMINGAGGINGRKIVLMSLDDAYSPPKTVEQTRRLVEQEGVALIFGSLGTPTNLAVRKYLNSKGVPSLLLAAGATSLTDPRNYPLTIAWQPNYFEEAAAYAAHALRDNPGEKVAILYAKDDSGKDYADGFKAGLGDKISLLVEEAVYETLDPSVTSQIARLKASGATVFFFHATPKFGALILRGISDIGWRPATYVASTASSIAGTIEPAGFERAQGIISSSYLKDANDPEWADDAEMKAWRAWMAKYNPKGDLNDGSNVYAYAQAAAMVKILEQAGNDLSRRHIMSVATNINFRVPLLLPGISLQTSTTDYRLIKKVRLMRFEGQRWVLLPA